MTHPHKFRQLIRSYEAKALKRRTFVGLLADALTSTFGTIGFLIFNILLFAFWLLVNSERFPIIDPFDPYPYTMLTTVVSLEAIVLTIIVMMSQNRASVTSIIREELELQVGLITEKEITMVLKLLKKYLEKNNVDISDPELDEMLKEVDTSYIERKLEEQIIPKSKTNPVEFVEHVEKKIIEKGQF
jgi:uncharacterized membrane protein